MTTDIIIDVYSKRPFLQRLVSNGSTTFLWGVWGWICRFHHFFSFRLFWLGLPRAATDDAMALISTSSVLLFWSTLKSDVPEAKQLTIKDYAEHFELSEEHLNIAKESKISVVHHDNYGRITSIQRI